MSIVYVIGVQYLVDLQETALDELSYLNTMLEKQFS